MSVLIGLTDIASFIDDWSDGFNRKGLKTFKVTLEQQSLFQTSTIDYVIEANQNALPKFRPYKLSNKLKPIWDKWVHNYCFRIVIN